MKLITRIVTKSGVITADDRKIVVRLKYGDRTPGILYKDNVQVVMQAALGAAMLANSVVSVEMR